MSHAQPPTVAMEPATLRWSVKPKAVLMPEPALRALAFVALSQLDVARLPPRTALTLSHLNPIMASAELKSALVVTTFVN